MSARLLVVMAVAFSGCKDPTVGPPPRKLDSDQALRVAGSLLKQRPTPRHAASPNEVTLGGGKVRYLGSDVRPETAVRGQRLQVSHYFEALGELDKSWKMFVHVQGAEQGGILVNADHHPVEGLYPTDRWEKGQLIEDSYAITVPSHAPDELACFIGFYRFDDRLPVDQRAAHDGANRIPAFRVRVGGGSPELPTYRASRLKSGVTVDGVLDDPAWKTTATTGAFLRTDNGSSPKYRTEARIGWDEKALYVAFDVQDPDVWAKLEKDDEPIYGEEVAEVFLDADGDGRNYNELQVSPRNVRFDAYFPGAPRQNMDLAWSSGMETAVKVKGTLNDPSDQDEGWTAEMRIPVERLAGVPRWPPQPGDRWRFNLYRLEWHSERRVNEGSAFSPPLVGDFHYLSRFGYLELAP